MNPMRNWGRVYFKLKHPFKTGTLYKQPLYNFMFVKHRRLNNKYELLLSYFKELDYPDFRNIFSKTIEKHGLEAPGQVEVLKIEPPNIANPFKLYLPYIYFYLLKLPVKEYVKIMGLEKADYHALNILKKYFTATPYYYTPFQAVHTGDELYNNYARIMTLIEYFDPRTLKFVALDNKTLVPVMLPYSEYLSKIGKLSIYSDWNSEKPVLKFSEFRALLWNLLKKLYIPKNSLISEKFALNLFGFDLVGHVVSTSRDNTWSMLLMYNDANYSIFKQKPIALTGNPPKYISELKDNSDTIKYFINFDRNLIIYADELDKAKYIVIRKGDSVIVNNDAVIIQRGDKSNVIVLKVVEHNVYNDTVLKLMKKYLN